MKARDGKTDPGASIKKNMGKKVYAGLFLVTVFLNILAWTVRGLSDWYIAHIFPIWVNTYGRFCGLFSFSVGELLLGGGVFLLLFAAALAPVWLVCAAVRAFRRKKGVRSRFGKFCRRFYRVFAWILLFVLLIMTLNCFMLYHGSYFNERYFGKQDREYSLEELTAVRNYVVEQCNLLSEQMERDERGDIIYRGDMTDTAIAAMRRMGEFYDGLSGYYPRPKPLACSDFMCQQYMQGYYFPFSMEANYNDVMYLMNKPATLCHELAHLKGYIYEDEANFIGYLACISSDDIVFVYSGYLSVLYYLDNDFYDAVGCDLERYYQEPRIADQVYADNIFVKQEEWDRINKKALVETEVVEAASESFTEATLKMNGVQDGMISYSRVVKLLLQYYEGGSF